MNRHTRTYILAMLFAGAASFALVGCTQNTAPTVPSAPPAKTSGASDAEHGHKQTTHGGIVVPIGSDSYHAEAVFEKGGVLRLYTLGKDEAKVMEVQSQALTAYVKLVGGTESESIILNSKPQPGDKEGMTTLFVGHLPKELAGKNVEVTIPRIQIGQEKFRIAFKSVQPGGDDHGMPASIADEEEKKVFLTPGGKYTASDIKANGNTVASIKFKGIKPVHDTNPKPGEILCPISMTKANPKFSWIIGGKTYQFCCLPCVQEFVILAKEKPDEVKNPEAYVKQ
mgnify:CR=1 FL=1